MTIQPVDYYYCRACHAVTHREGCHNCRHFVQHYHRRGAVFYGVDAGHCTAGKRFKQCKPSNRGCVNWEEKAKGITI